MALRGTEPVHDSLPSPKEGEPALKYGQRVEDVLMEDERKARRGGHIDGSFKRTTAYFAQAYAFIHDANRNYLHQEDLEDSVGWGLASDGQLTEHKLKTFPKKIKGRFKQLGWTEVDHEYLPPEHDLAERESLIVTRHCPSIDQLRADLEDGEAITRGTIREYVSESPSYIDESETESEDPDLIASVGAVETQADEGSWLLAEGVDSDIRIWVSSTDLLEALGEFLEDESKVRGSEIADTIINFIDQRVQQLPAETRIDVGRAIDRFEKQLREFDWRPISTESDTIWHANYETHEDTLREQQQPHEEVLDKPIDYSADAIEPTYEFLSQNKRELVRTGLWEHEALDTQISILEYHIQADKRLTELAHGEPTYRYGKVGSEE